MTIYTIPQKASNTGSIDDAASDQRAREIVFARGCKYAVVIAAFYGGSKGYTTHATEAAAAAASRRVSGYRHQIIDTTGQCYTADSYNGRLIPTGREVR